jgi:hypothetical protein
LNRKGIIPQQHFLDVYDEVLAAQSVVSTLPPSVENAPLEMQPDLLKMQNLSIEELRLIAFNWIEGRKCAIALENLLEAFILTFM